MSTLSNTNSMNSSNVRELLQAINLINEDIKTPQQHPPESPAARKERFLKEIEPPAGAVFDDTECVFKGFFTESVADSALEKWRMRNIIIRFFLKDAKTEIDEAQVRILRIYIHFVKMMYYIFFLFTE